MDCSAQGRLSFLAESCLGNSHLNFAHEEGFATRTSEQWISLFGLSLAARATSWKLNLGLEIVVLPGFNTWNQIWFFCLTVCYPSCFTVSRSSFQALVKPVAHLRLSAEPCNLAALNTWRFWLLYSFSLWFNTLSETFLLNGSFAGGVSDTSCSRKQTLSRDIWGRDPK